MSYENETLTRMRHANPAVEADADELGELWSVVDEAMVTEHPGGARQPKESPSGSPRLRPAVVIAVAVLVTLAVFLPLALLRGGTPEASDEPAATTATTVSPATTVVPTAIAPLALATDPLELRWRRVEMPGLSGGYLWFDSVVAGGPGLIAVGSPMGLESGFIWTSEDGVDWSPADHDGIADPGYAFDVVAGGPGYVAVGSSIWSSSDGITWSDAAVDYGGVAALEYAGVGELKAVTAGGPGYVAVGRFAGDVASIYTSTDGLSWSLIPRGGAPEAQIDSEITDIVAAGPGLVAVGNYGSIGAVWTSPDGFEWTRVPLDRAVFGDGSEGTEFSSVAAGESGLIAVGRITDDSTLGVWHSDDGLTWSVVPLDPTVLNESHELATVIGTDAGFFAGGAGENDDAGLWFSPDGFDWMRLDTGEALGGPGYQAVNDITVWGDHLIAVGAEFVDGVDSEVVWIGEPVRE